MKYRIGDKVKFLHDKGQGEISAIIDKNKVMVRTEDGFDVPYILSDLVKYGELENKILSGGDSRTDESTEEETISYESEEQYTEPVDDEEVVFAVRKGKSAQDLLSYLVNSSSYNIFYTVSKLIEGEDNLLAQGKLEPDTKVGLVKLVPGHLDEIWKIRISLLFWNHSFFKALKPVSILITLDFTELIRGEMMTVNDYFEQEAGIFLLHSFLEKEKEELSSKLNDINKLADAIAEKEEKKEERKAEKVQRKLQPEEVDLHIESIVDEYKSLSNGEILELQMSRFKTALETAIIHNSRRIVFIHGVGNGKLKYELRNTLERKYPDLKYQDASFREYGYGATMVIIPPKKR